MRTLVVDRYHIQITVTVYIEGGGAPRFVESINARRNLLEEVEFTVPSVGVPNVAICDGRVGNVDQRVSRCN